MSLLFASALFAASLIPLDDLGGALYDYGYFGGLWEHGSNIIPADHLAAGMSHADRIQPLDIAGRPSPTGRIGFLIVGSTEAARIGEAFRRTAEGDRRVEHDSLSIVNAAATGLDALRWTLDRDPTYDWIARGVLAPAGLSEKQVQVAWVQLITDHPYSPLPIQDGDAYRLKGSYAAAMRALKKRYPNLQIAYLSSRVYGGYATTQWNPEPYAYESGLAVRWTIVGQVEMTRIIGPHPDSRLGNLRYESGAAPWLAWGPYLWANGTTPRSDGLIWERDDFDLDGETISARGAQKAGKLLLDFLLAEPTAARWFRSDEPVAPRARPARHRP